ncbi:MAG: DUF3570 domain-containing protein, partial [Chitinophagaceae bacterium]
MVVREAVVVVTKFLQQKKLRNKKCSVNVLLTTLFALLSFVSISSLAAVLPDDRVDLLDHIYDGGGITVDGPSVLVRKSIGSSVSVSANYYVDMVSSASIDVLASASKYSEERNEKSVGMDYFHDRTSYSIGYTTSDENDYNSKTYHLGVSQTFFGDLTTLGFGFSFGKDIVGRNLDGEPDPDFRLLNKDRRKYTLNLSQILTKNLIAEVSVESGSDACIGMKEGESCLNNPYRSVRWYNEQTATGGMQSEIYPLTHNTDAIGVRFMYHLPYAATIRLDGRNFSDSWGIKAK